MIESVDFVGIDFDGTMHFSGSPSWLAEALARRPDESDSIFVSFDDSGAPVACLFPDKQLLTGDVIVYRNGKIARVEAGELQ